VKTAGVFFILKYWPIRKKQVQENSFFA